MKHLLKNFCKNLKKKFIRPVYLDRHNNRCHAGDWLKNLETGDVIQLRNGCCDNFYGEYGNEYYSVYPNKLFIKI